MTPSPSSSLERPNLLFAGLLQQVSRDLVFCDREKLATIAWALTITLTWKDGRKRNAGDTTPFVVQEGGAPPPQAALLADVALAAREALPEFAPRDLASLAWAFAKSAAREEAAFLDGIARAARRRLRELQASELTNTAWAFATLGFRRDGGGAELLRAVAAEALRRLDAFGPQDLALATWAFATVQLSEEGRADCAEEEEVELEAFFAGLAGRTLSRLTEFNPQDLSNAAWAWAKLATPQEELLAGIATRVVRAPPDGGFIAEFTQQGLTNLAWAFATLGGGGGGLNKQQQLRRPHTAAPAAVLEVVAAWVLRRIGDCNPQDLANTAWAFAKLELRQHEDLLAAIAAQALRTDLDGFTPQNLASMAWAFAALELRQHHELMEGIARRTLRAGLLGEFNPQD